MKVKEEFSLQTVNPKTVAFARMQTLLTIQKNIRNMSKIIISSKNKPIMSAALEQQIEAAMSQFLNRRMWLQWGMDGLRKQGNAVLLEGPAGTGKTTIARYMSKRIGKGMETLNMKDVGGKAPGHTERMTHQFFIDCKNSGNKTIFMDECEAISWDRSKAGSDAMWMVGVIDEILMQTVEYPGLIVMATNIPDIVDPALKDRCFAVLKVPHPELPERLRLWRQKIPDRFPFKPTQLQIERLAEFSLTGRQIENAIVHEASLALVQKREPRFQGIVEACKQLAA